MTARTITLPVNPGSSAWGFFAWPSKEASDSLPYVIDATAWLADGGFTLTAVDLSVSPDLYATVPTINGGLISVTIAGGTSGATSYAHYLLHLSGGFSKAFSVALPCVADAAPSLVPISLTPDPASNNLFIL